jgi:hypothetical protein
MEIDLETAALQCQQQQQTPLAKRALPDAKQAAHNSALSPSPVLVSRMKEGLASQQQRMKHPNMMPVEGVSPQVQGDKRHALTTTPADKEQPTQLLLQRQIGKPPKRQQQPEQKTSGASIFNYLW